MRTAVLGAGKMGVWFAKFCKAKGDTVVLADRNAEKLAKLEKELGVLNQLISQPQLRAPTTS